VALARRWRCVSLASSLSIAGRNIGSSACSPIRTAGVLRLPLLLTARRAPLRDGQHQVYNVGPQDWPSCRPPTAGRTPVAGLKVLWMHGASLQRQRGFARRDPQVLRKPQTGTHVPSIGLPVRRSGHARPTLIGGRAPLVFLAVST
jgi:hypothetical protein